jgi:hypothetical protein
MKKLGKKDIEQNIYNITSESELLAIVNTGLVNKENFLLSSFCVANASAIPWYRNREADQEWLFVCKGELRFLLNEASLVITTNITSDQVYNSLENYMPHNNNLTFLLGVGHSAIKLECNSCDNGKSVHKFYDLNGDLLISDYAPMSGGGYKLEFFLDDEQADRSFSAISNIYAMSKVGRYKYVAFMHNCVSLLVDVYKDSGFPHHLSQYLRNGEILRKDLDIFYAFTYRFYYTYPDNYLDSYRDKVKNFVKLTIHERLEEFKEDEAFKSLFNESLGMFAQFHLWMHKDINIDLANKDQFIFARIAEIKEIRKSTCLEFIEFSSLLPSNKGITSHELNEITQYCLDRNITYDDLYYAYVNKHLLNIMRLFSDIDNYPHEDFIKHYCHELSHISHCRKIMEEEYPFYMGNHTVNLTGNHIGDREADLPGDFNNEAMHDEL